MYPSYEKKNHFLYQAKIINTIPLILYKKIICVYFEGDTRHVSAQCGHIIGLWMLLYAVNLQTDIWNKQDRKLNEQC